MSVQKQPLLLLTLAMKSKYTVNHLATEAELQARLRAYALMLLFALVLFARKAPVELAAVSPCDCIRHTSVKMLWLSKSPRGFFVGIQLQAGRVMAALPSPALCILLSWLLLPTRGEVVEGKSLEPH